MSWLRILPPSWGEIHILKDGAITRSLAGANEVKFIAPEPFALILLTPQPRRELALGTDKKVIFDAPACGIELVPENADLFARWRAPKESILTSINPIRLKRLAGLEFGCDDVNLRLAKPGSTDPMSTTLAKLIHQEAIRPEGTNINGMEALTVLFWLQMLRNYSNFAKDVRSLKYRGGLPPRILRLVEEYIDANISEPLALDALAEVTGYSPSHFMRSFRTTMGMPPHQFVIKRRLARAEQMIRKKNCDLRMVALSCGFASQSHMTSVMKKHWGLTPKQLR